MFKDERYLAIIPARGGSKGIPRKNVKLLKGKPLIAYSIEAALASSYIDSVIVSTDDDEIAETSKRCGAEVIKRPKELASDTAAIIDSLLHIISVIDAKYDVLVLLQPTSPLRMAIHIDEAIELYGASSSDSLASISLVQDSPVLIRELMHDDSLIPLLQGSSTIRRQDMKEYYRINGAIYINKISILNINSSLNDNKIGYVMERMYSLDIDDSMDLMIADKLLDMMDL